MTYPRPDTGFKRDPLTVKGVHTIGSNKAVVHSMFLMARAPYRVGRVSTAANIYSLETRFMPPDE